MPGPGDIFYSLFLNELAGLDAFAAEREATRSLPLGREDPDVRRLLEALAFFSARTRAAAAAEVRAAVGRMAAGALAELMTPMPAAALVRAQPDERVADPLTLPRETWMRAALPDGRVALLTTLRSLEVLPLKVGGARLRQLRQGLALELSLAAWVPQRDVGEISFSLRRLADYRASLALFDALERRVSRAEVLYDPTGAGDREPARCEVSFGEPRRDFTAEGGPRGPFERLRWFFHAPEQHLFLSARLPAASAPWRTALIRLHLDGDWPEELVISPDCFQLFVVPVANQWTDFAEPQLYDGTKQSVPIRAGGAAFEALEPQAVRGVYRSTDDGLSPIPPASLARAGDGFEVDEDADGRLRLILRLPGAFEKPRKILIDALWSQPGLWSAAVGQLSLRTQKRHLAGVTYRVLGELRGPAPSPLAHNPERVLDVLARRQRPFDNAEDLAGVLTMLGASGYSPYRDMPALLESLSRREAPDPAWRRGGIKQVYSLTLRGTKDDDVPLVRRFVAQIAALLDAWSQEAHEMEVAMRLGQGWQMLEPGG